MSAWCSGRGRWPLTRAISHATNSTIELAPSVATVETIIPGMARMNRKNTAALLSRWRSGIARRTGYSGTSSSVNGGYTSVSK